MTIGMIYIKSGSANVATTGIGSGRKNGQCHCGHPREQQTKRTGYWSTGTYYEADRVNVTIGTNYRSGSAIVATTQEADKMMRTVPR
jgi:hypothetical protein